MADKKKFLDTFIKGIKLIITEDNVVMNHNIELVTNLINGMTGDKFEKFLTELETGQKVISLIVPNGSKAIKYENIISLFDTLGESLHERIYITENGKRRLSPIKRLVLYLPLKKLIQTIAKKRSIPDNNRSINRITGQPTGESKGASLTGAELPLMIANGMTKSAKELTIYRGGDKGAKGAMDKLIEQGRSVDMNIIKQYSSGPEVNNALKQYLRAMHIDSNIGEI